MKASCFLTAVSMLAVICVLGQSAYAEDAEKRFSGDVSFEVQNDFVTESDDDDAEVNTLTTTIEPSIKVALTERLAIEAGLVLEQVQDPDAGDDTYFDNHGVYVEQLKLSYSGENWSVFAGKYNAVFGTAWDVTPGVYGVDFAEDYEMTEKLGLGGSIGHDFGVLGTQTLSAGLFFADTSFLSNSSITKRDDLDLNDGGVANTEDFASFTASLDGADFAGLKGLNTHLSLRSQSEGHVDTDTVRENGYAAGINYTRPLSERVEMFVMGEWAGLRDEGGTSGKDVDYLNLGGSLVFDSHWNLGASFTSRDTKETGLAELDDEMYQISAGYAFDNGFGIDVGYKSSEESDVDTQTAGVLLSYGYEF